MVGLRRLTMAKRAVYQNECRKLGSVIALT